MNWLHSPSGRRLDLLSLHPDDVCIEDIALQLAGICRFTGGPSEVVDGERQPKHYSVGEHACIVHDAAPPSLKALALLHDAGEYLTGDLAGPFKDLLYVGVLVGEGRMRHFVRVKEFEMRLLDVILDRFGVSHPLRSWEAVMTLDKRLLAAEAPQVYPDTFESRRAEWSLRPDPLPVKLEFWSPLRAQREFLSRFNALNRK